MPIKQVARGVLLLTLMLTIGVLSASAVPIVSINPSSQVVSLGQHVSFDVRIDNVTDLYAFQFDLAFDPTLLSLPSITEGPFLPTGRATFFIPGAVDNIAGTLTFNADSLLSNVPGINGSGILALISLQAIASSTSSLTLSNVILLDSTGATIPLSDVPEPSTWLLLATGVLGLLAYGWRRRPRAV